jgi:hypothetical protein
VYFWHLGKKEAIEMKAYSDGYTKGVDAAEKAAEKSKKIAAKFIKKRKAAASYYGKIEAKMETYRETSPPSYSVNCDLDDQRLRLLNDAIGGPVEAPGDASDAVRPPSKDPGQEADGLRPSDKEERGAGPQLRGSG